MRIERTGTDRARALISGSELRRAGLRAEDILKGSPAAALLISEMAGRAFPEAGKHSVSVEIVPAKWGGCIFIMTRKPTAAKLCSVIITAYSVNDIIGICREIASMGISCPESSVTGNGSCLHLITGFPEDILLPEVFPEGGRIFFADDTALAKLSEHDRVIVPENAVEILSGLPH